jgi:hypothetical protein
MASLVQRSKPRRLGWLGRHRLACRCALDTQVRSQESGAPSAEDGRDLRSRPVMRLILTSDGLGEASRNGQAVRSA